jgi:hypothetical protein
MTACGLAHSMMASFAKGTFLRRSAPQLARRGPGAAIIAAGLTLEREENDVSCFMEFEPPDPGIMGMTLLRSYRCPT